LKSYRTVVDDALDYYNEAVYYERLIEIYRRYSEDLNALTLDERLKPEDRARIDSVKGSADTTRNIYFSRRLEDLQILRSYLALDDPEEFKIEVPEYRFSPLAANALELSGLNGLLDLARSNNPTFTVLRDAKNNAELQRQRALKGRYDVTAFLEGTTFPLGSPTYDNRFEGWTVGGGLNVRLNDRRVLKATQLKAEAQIRQFEAEIEAEDLLLRRRIVTETRGLLENHRNREQILDLLKQKEDEYRGRKADYFSGRINVDQLIDTRSGLTSSESTLASNSYSASNRESRLLLAIGRAYEIVGLRINEMASSDGR
jgi:outer membrane protein TolC